MFIGGWLVILTSGNIWEMLLCLAHDLLGHFGFEKLYSSLWNSYYWPNMWKDLESAYVPSCAKCQCNKSKMMRPAGPLHPLHIHDQWGYLVMGPTRPWVWSCWIEEIRGPAKEEQQKSQRVDHILAGVTQIARIARSQRSHKLVLGFSILRFVIYYVY